MLGLCNVALIVTCAILAAWVCYTLLVSAWRGLQSAKVPLGDFERSTQPIKYWTKLSMTAALGISCGICAVYIGFWVVPFSWAALIQ